MTKRFLLLTGFLACASTLGCNLGNALKKSDSPTPTQSGVTPTPTGSGSPSPIVSETPATHPPMPQIKNNAGSIFAAPVIVPVIYDNDPNSAAEVTFLTKLVASSWWTAVTKGYGIGAGTVAPKISAGATAPTPTIDDATIQSNVDGYTSQGAQAIYVAFYPAGTTTTLNNAQPPFTCGSALAYHSITGGGRSYAVVPNCNSVVQFPTDLDEIGLGASHEILETATDASPGSGYSSAGAPFGVWDFVSSGGEVGDYCEYTPNIVDNEADIGSFTQRIWNNDAAAASQDPCVPAPGPYFNAAPEMPDTSTVAAQNGEGTSAAIIAVGSSKTVTLDLYANTSEPFTVFAMDQAALNASCTPGAACAQAELQITFGGTTNSSATGKNGDKVQMTIKVLKAGATDGISGGSAFFIISQQGTGQTAVLNLWPAYVSNS